MAGDKKKLNIGVVGYGFMGRTHSNAFTSNKIHNFGRLYWPIHIFGYKSADKF